MSDDLRTLVLVLLNGLFFVSIYYIGFFQTIINTIIILAIVGIIHKLKEIL